MTTPANYKILPRESSDWTKGYEIQAPEKTFISWDIPIRKMFENHEYLLKISTYGDIRFKYPVRVGNMILENFKTSFTNDKDPGPFTRFDAHCVHSQQADKGFGEIHRNLLRQLNNPVDIFYDEQHNLLRSVFQLNGLDLVDYQQGIDERGDVLLRWINHRDYPYLLENSAYEKKMVISDQCVWEEKRLELGKNYRQNVHIKRSPSTIHKKFGNRTVVWKDNDHRILGFAQGDKAHLYPLDGVDHLSVQSVEDSRIGFGATLRVHLKPDHWKPVPVLEYTGDPGKVDFFERVIRDLEKVVQKPVKTTE